MKEKIHELIANSAGYLYWINTNGKLVGANEAFINLVKIKKLNGSALFDILKKQTSGASSQSIEENNAIVIANKTAKTFQEYFRLNGHKELIFLSQKIPLINETGELTGLVNLSVDITSFKEKENKQLIAGKNAQIALQNIVSNLPGHVYWKDENGIYLGCNDKQAKSLGLEHGGQVVGKSDFELPWNHEDAKKFRENDLRIMHSGEAEVFEETATMDGQPAIVLSHKTPLRNEKNHIIGILGISLNITDRKKAEEELRKAKESAEAANKATKAFLENMRHDLRTALSGIEGNAQLIYDKVESKELQEYTENLIVSCRVLTLVHNQVLNATRVFAGDIPLYKKKFDLEAKLKQVINLNLAKATSKRLKFTLTHDDAIPRYLVGDCKRISIIALELVTNALKYTEKGQVSIETHLHKKEGREVFVKLSISDTGIGIPEEQQEAIFMRFNRLTPSYEGKYRGLGLGLSVIKQFMDELDGEIYVESKEGEGTTISCYFPLKEAIADNDEGLDTSGDLFDMDTEVEFASPKRRLPEPATDMEGKSRILVVEDQPIAAQVASGILSNLSCVVDVAENGKEALEKASINTYDLIFMDVGLPDMDGNAVTRHIREMERDTELHVPIVALTAHVDSEHKQRCVEAGMDAVLNKPLVKERAADMLSAFIPSRSKKLEKPTVDEEIVEEMDHLFNLEGVVIDLEQGADLVAADEDMAKTMLEMMLKNFNEEKTDLVEAHKTKNWNKVKDIVHKLRGGMAYCGTPRLHQAGLHLEDYLKTEQTDLAEKLYEQFISEVEKVKTEFEALE